MNKRFLLGIPILMAALAGSGLPFAPQGVAAVERTIAQRLSAGDYFQRGLNYHRSREYNRAIVNYTKAIRLNPNYAEAYYERGRAYGIVEDYTKAIADFEESIRLNYPQLWLPYISRGFLYYKQQEYRKAIADYTEAIRLNPDYADSYLYRGICHRQLKEFRKAIADYSEAIELEPNFGEAHYNRGIVYYYGLGNEKRALEDFQRAAELYREQGKDNYYQDALDRIEELQG